MFAFLLLILHNIVHVIEDDEFISNTKTRDIESISMGQELEILDADYVQNNEILLAALDVVNDVDFNLSQMIDIQREKMISKSAIIQLELSLI